MSVTGGKYDRHIMFSEVSFVTDNNTMCAGFNPVWETSVWETLGRHLEDRWETFGRHVKNKLLSINL